MPNSFLGSVVQQLVAQNIDWANVCFVLPNRRARLFLQRELTQTLQGPLILPEAASIDDLIASMSTMLPATELQQQQALYKSYCTTIGLKKADSFETFLGWSSPLMKDINTMDQYLLERESFFTYLSSLHNIRSWGENQDKIIQNYTAFWELLPQMYQDFVSILEETGHAPPGLCYRLATAHLESYLQHKKSTHFIFCGFNALSPSEELIVQELLAQQRGQVFWDIDQKMLENEYHQAGVFIRGYVNNWSYYANGSFDQAHQIFNAAKKVNVIEVQQQVGQAKQLGALLAELPTSQDWSKTAVVLADESLLLPLLYALPDTIDQLNITMGYPLEQHPLAMFVSSFMKMVIRKTAVGFYYKDVEALLSLPESQVLFAEHDKTFCTNVLNQAKKEHRSFLSTAFISKIAPESALEVTTQLFQETRTPEQWIDGVLALLPIFYTPQQTQSLTEVYRVAVEKLLGLFHQIKEVSEGLNEEVTFTLLRSLYAQLSAGQKLDFVGAPLEGLQILGVLETRTIDFDRVLLAGVNEGILPSQGGQPSWIPYDVKKEFGLPTQEEQDAIFTYHFYRLMYRASEVYMLYNGTTDGIQVGERSRFIRQWAYECPPTHNWQEQIQEAVFIPPVQQIKSVPKTKSVLKKLFELGENGFSPSALNLFVKDEYAFYKRYILGLKDEDELEESFSHRTYGTLVHNCLEALYAPYVGKTLIKADCIAMIGNIDAVAEKVVKAIYPHDISGKNVLAFAAIKRNIAHIINAEKEEIVKGNTISLLALEQKLKASLIIPGMDSPINIRGTVDRIDRYNGNIRVLDYKTGKVGKLGISDWDLLGTDPEYGQARQLLLYSMLWNDAHPSNKANHAGIIALKEHDKGVRYVGEKTSARNIDNELSPAIMQHAVRVFTEIIQRLFDAQLSFSEPED